jgi:MFS family permease
MLPIFGAISDKVMTKFGKRTPFILIGTVVAVALFIGLALVDNMQLPAVVEGTDIPALYEEAVEYREAAYELLAEGRHTGNSVMVAEAEGMLKTAEEMFESVRAATFAITAANILPLVLFIGLLLLVLIAMATFRSPAVALMPDVTIKPLRSKGNAVINLMGTAGGIIVLLLGMVFKTSKNHYMEYTSYILAVSIIMLVGLIIFLHTVKERKWAKEAELKAKELELDKPEAGADVEKKRKLSRPELISLMLILASVALWFIGYNSITSKYSVYASNILGFDYNLTLIVAQGAAIVSYIPVGIIASKIGRKKSILAGIIMLGTAFFIGNFITANSPELLMYPIFALAGIGWATINVNSFPMVVELAKGGEVGRYTGFYYTASMAAQIVAPIFSGILYDRIGMRVVFFAFGTVFVALSFVTMLFVRHGDSKAERQSALESLGGADD